MLVSVLVVAGGTATTRSNVLTTRSSLARPSFHQPIKRRIAQPEH
jgi:hypothetical protein